MRKKILVTVAVLIVGFGTAMPIVVNTCCGVPVQTVDQEYFEDFGEWMI